MRALFALFLAVVLPVCSPQVSIAACDCGSADEANPCTGQAIVVTVTAGTPNGGTAVNNVYNWSFNSGGKDARCGQFANGDYWVAPADGETTVTLTGVSSSSHPSHISADENPATEAIGLLSGVKSYGNYSAAENIISTLPKSYSSATSIVAAIERDASREGGCGTASIVGECADSYNVLTVLDSVPLLAGAETIRPNMNGTYKELLSFSDFEFARVPKKAFLSGTDAAGLDNITRRWSHSIETLGLNTTANSGGDGFSEGGRAFRAHTLIDDYGAGTAAAWYNDLMILFSDAHTDQEKKRPLAAMLAYGLDLYHAIYDPPAGVTRYWGSGATQHPGKFMPAVLLAALAKDSKYANNVKTASAHLRDHASSGPLELAQIHTGKNGPVWGDIPALSGAYFLGAYWGDVMRSQCYDGATGVCTPAIGAKTMYDPHGYIDGPPNKPGTSYFGSSLGIQRSMVATMFLMPSACDVVNYDALVQYVDRTISHGVQAGNDPCVTPDSREDFANCDPYRNKGCLYYGVTWGPQNPADPKSQCITTPTPPYTKVGRFSGLDGLPVGAVYTSGQIVTNWAAIRGSASSCRDLPRRLFRNVRLADPIPVPPTLTAGTVASTATDVYLLFSETVEIGTGGNGGWSMNCAATGAISMTYSSGDTTNTLAYSLSDTPIQGETCTVAYTQPTDGIEAVDDGTDLATIPSMAVTNNSTVQPEGVACTGSETFLRGDSASGDTESFEMGVGDTCASDWTIALGPGMSTYSSGAANSGTHSLLIADDNTISAGYISADYGTAQTEQYYRFYLKVSSIENYTSVRLGGPVKYMDSVSSFAVQVNKESASSLVIDLMGAENVKIAADEWYRVELKATDADGSATTEKVVLEMRVYNSAGTLLETNEGDTTVSSTTTVDQFRYFTLKPTATAETASVIYIDDVKNCNTWCGAE